MKKKIKKMFCLVTAITCMPLATAFGGSLLVYTTAEGDMSLYSDGSRLRMDSVRDGGKQSLVYEEGKPGMLMIDHTKNEYSTFDPSAVSKQMQEAMKQLEGLPPEQKKMMQEMMKGMKAGAAGGAATGVRKVELKFVKNEKVGKYDSKLHKVMVNGKEESKVWMASFAEVGVKLADMKGYEKFAKEMKKIVDSMPMMKDMVPEEIFSEAQLGVAVQSGEGKERFTLKEAKTVDYKASQFQVPAGYKEKKIELE